MKDLKKGQLVFVKRVFWQDEDSEIAIENEPAIFDHEETVVLNEKKFVQWWFRYADGTDGCIRGVEGFPGAPRTAEEVFGFKPSI